MHDDLFLQKCLTSDIFVSTSPQADMKDWTVFLQSQGNCRWIHCQEICPTQQGGWETGKSEDGYERSVWVWLFSIIIQHFSEVETIH